MATDVEPVVRERERATRPDGSYYSSDPAVRHAQLVEDGKLGAKGSELAREHGRRGGRPRKPRAAELVAEKARQEAERIWAAFDDALHDDQPVRVRMEAAQAVLKIERDEASLQLDEEKFDQMSDEEMMAELRELQENPLIRAALGDAE